MLRPARFDCQCNYLGCKALERSDAPWGTSATALARTERVQMDALDGDRAAEIPEKARAPDPEHADEQDGREPRGGAARDELTREASARGPRTYS